MTPAAKEGSLAAISRSYGIAARQIYSNKLSSAPELAGLPSGSYNAELVVQLSPDMHVIGNFGHRFLRNLFNFRRGSTMKKFGIRLFISLIITLVIGIPAIQANDISPVGEKIASDSQGHAIYQINGNGIKIGYKLIGSGEPLMLLTGLGDTMDNWSPMLIEAASKKYQLIIMDNRGMGYTTDNGVKFTYRLFAKDVIGLLDALGVQKTNVLGFSQSSVTTQNLLLYYPERVNKAIVHATSTKGSAVAAASKGKPLPDNPTIKKQLQAAMEWKTPLDKCPSSRIR